jgi:hypothetical protein
VANPSYVSSASAADTADPSITVSAPGSISSGDLLVAILGVGASGDPAYTPPSGWTLWDHSSEASNPEVWVYTKVAGGSEPGSYTWTSSGTIGRFTDGVILNLANAAVDGSPAFATGTSTAPQAPAISTSAANGLVVAAFVEGTTLSSGPSGMTLAIHQPQIVSSPDETAYYESFASAGSQGPFTAANSGSQPWAAVSLAFKNPDNAITQTPSQSSSWGTPISPPAITLTVTDADTSGTDTVNFQISHDNTFATGVKTASVGPTSLPESGTASTVSSAAMAALGLTPGTWYWRAETVPSDGIGAPTWCATQSFTIMEML